MKRWLTHAVIGIYLSALGFGFFAHAFDFLTGCHPVMYFLVWDMFCGWSGYEGRMEVIGEGESGKFYELAPGPWGEFHPYGFIARQHYDPEFMNGECLGKNTLKHTTHEPMVRIFVVEEEFPKKLNMPDALYEAYYNKPKVPHCYYHTRFVFTPTGEVLSAQPVWFRYQRELGIRDNPRLIADAFRTRPFFATGPQMRGRGAYASGTFYEPPSLVPVGSPLAE